MNLNAFTVVTAIHMREYALLTCKQILTMPNIATFYDPMLGMACALS